VPFLDVVRATEPWEDYLAPLIEPEIHEFISEPHREIPEPINGNGGDIIPGRIPSPVISISTQRNMRWNLFFSQEEFTCDQIEGESFSYSMFESPPRQGVPEHMDFH